MIFRNHFAALLALGLVSAPVAGFAESHSTGETEGEAAAASSSAVGATLGAELLEELAAAEAEVTADMAAINAELDNLIQDEQQAEQVFDRMIAAVRTQADLGNPEGDFVGRVDALIDTSRELLIEAREDGDPDLIASVEGTITSLEDTKDAAVKLYADSFKSIRDIESQKAKVVLRIRARLLERAAEEAKKGLAIVEKTNDAITKIRDTIAPEATDDAEAAVD